VAESAGAPKAKAEPPTTGAAPLGPTTEPCATVAGYFGATFEFTRPNSY
jgi:hypothetical protein